MFFGNGEMVSAMVERRALPIPPWYLTDDSIMAIGIVETLRQWMGRSRYYLRDRGGNCRAKSWFGRQFIINLGCHIIGDRR
jgi:hypothetical protein